MFFEQGGVGGEGEGGDVMKVWQMTGIKRERKTHAAVCFVLFLGFTVILGIKLSRRGKSDVAQTEMWEGFFFLNENISSFLLSPPNYTPLTCRGEY